ncbi:heterogeneous nuclear ribonucleoprotein U-like protein 2 [Morone saxatilis]|uniref:heterogeneous nuclear ribonucleoprotein U-like protein 2 n=1 Tax=Morone saxatilis TaxID=34816 RepID=UPI0015E1E3C5|nr:heterogeneous nuclear ribonucleoprotein U-like protein 2 [Morone saxatilis]
MTLSEQPQIRHLRTAPPHADRRLATALVYRDAPGDSRLATQEAAAAGGRNLRTVQNAATSLCVARLNVVWSALGSGRSPRCVRLSATYGVLAVLVCFSEAGEESADKQFSDLPGPTFRPLAPFPSVHQVPLAVLLAWVAAHRESLSIQCEVLLMVGLPGSGKSHWARTHMKQHPEKQYRLLGTEELLACMISGGQRDSRLQQASQCLTDLIKMAAQTPGNYILDQCNILFSARRYKLQLFTGFRRKVVVVFPSADEWKRRLSLHQTSDGEQIPETALLKLQVSCSLPEQQSDLLEELQYVGLPRDQAQTLLQEYKEEARRLLPPIAKQDKKKPRFYKKRPHPHGPPPSHRMQWTGLHGWNNGRLNMQPWRQQPRYWNMAYQDQSYYRDFGYEGY